jgi:hypothetical protein
LRRRPRGEFIVFCYAKTQYIDEDPAEITRRVRVTIDKDF